MTGIVTLSCMLDAVHNGTSSKDFSYFKKVYDSFTHVVHAIESLGERDEELQALRRQIEKLALQIEHHEALMKHRASKRSHMFPRIIWYHSFTKLLGGFRSIVPMAARRDRGKANYRLIENLKGERDEELQALRRQIEELALQIEHHGARMKHRASKRRGARVIYGTLEHQYFIIGFKDTEESNFNVEKPIENKENPDLEVNQYLSPFIFKSELDNNN
ncbi:hypothetical protein ACE6H2_018973 [Prunus campanulata]